MFEDLIDFIKFVIQTLIGAVIVIPAVIFILVITVYGSLSLLEKMGVSFDEKQECYETIK